MGYREMRPWGVFRPEEQAYLSYALALIWIEIANDELGHGPGGIRRLYRRTRGKLKISSRLRQLPWPIDYPAL